MTDPKPDVTPHELQFTNCTMCGCIFKHYPGQSICETCIAVQENFPEIFSWVEAIHRYQRELRNVFERKMEAKLELVDEKLNTIIDLLRAYKTSP